MKLHNLALAAGCFALIAGPLALAATPTADPSAPTNPALKSQGDTTSSPLAKGHNSFTQSQAKGRIEKAGYTDVDGLVLDQDGLWQATATRDGHSVHVALDYKGDVATQ